MSTVAESLSSFAVRLKYNDLSEEAVGYCKHLLLDTIGVAFGGYPSKPSRIVQGLLEEVGGRPQATIIGSGQKTNCAYAALANGVMVRYLDYCDLYRGISPCHPSENIPVALAVGERQQSNGKDVILAIVLGYEFECRFVDAIPFTRLGWHHVTTGGYVTPLVAGKLIGLNERQMANAVGISGSTSNTFFSPYGKSQITMMKSMGYPLAAQSGINAALMAQKGFTGPTDIIETFGSRIGRDADLSPLREGGKELKILKCAIKAYATAGLMQSALTALFMLVKQHGITADVVEKILVRTYDFACTQGGNPKSYRPASRESADHSIPYCLSIGLIEGYLGPEQFEQDQWLDPKVLALMNKVEVVVDPELEKLFPTASPADVEIYTKKGESVRARVEYPKGDSSNRMTDGEVQEKFRKLTSGLIGEKKTDLIIDTVNNIEKIDDIGKLMDLLKIEAPEANSATFDQ